VVTGVHDLAGDKAYITGLLAHSQPEQRLEAALACYDKPDPDLLEPLTAALRREDNVKVRASLVKAVAAVGDATSIDLLLGYLRDPDARVRANAIEALSRYDDPRLVPHFERMVGDPHSRVAGNAIIALAPHDRIKFRDVVQDMARSALPAACLTALYVLSRFEEPWAVSLIGQMATRTDNPVSAQTMKILEQLANWHVPGARANLSTARQALAGDADDENLTVLRPPKVTPRNLDALLGAPSPRVRIFAVQESSQRMPADVVLPRLLARLPDETDPYVLATLTKWVGVVGGKACLDQLEPFLRHADDRVRANTLEGLQGRRAERIRSMAAACVDDPSPRVRAHAARILAQFDGREAFAILRDMVLAESEAGVASALHAVERLDEHQALEILELALLRGGPVVTTRVSTILAGLEDRLPLARRLRSKLESGSFAAQEGGYIREQIYRLASDDDAVRLAALNQLRYCRSPQAWDAIDELARGDRSERVRAVAADLAAQCRVERQRRVQFYSFGLRILQLYQQGQLKIAELYRLCEQVGLVEQALEDDDELSLEPIERLVVDRTNTLILLGERGWSVHRDGGLADDVLDAIAARLSALGPA